MLLHSIDTLATFDEQRRVLRNGWIEIRDGEIASLGAGAPPPFDGPSINLTGYVVLPGLINLHHHFFQSLLRSVPSLQDVALFRWLHDIYLIMSEVRDEDQYVASQVAIAELLLSGCTTTVDHSYLKVNDMKFETEIRAAREMGIRFHLARGSFSRGQKDGALPPDHIVEKEDDILADTERLIKAFHDPRPSAMVRVDNAPCSPFSVTERVWRESIEMARRHGVGNHCHMAEAPDEEAYMLATFGRRSVEMAEEWGWVGPDVWYAHATCLSDEEMSTISRTETGICSCPSSNMFTSARCCPIAPLLKQGGARIGLGVDGGATNNTSNMMQEVRNALLMQRSYWGADALSASQALELATLGGAKVLRRDDIGSLAPGRAADIIGYDTRQVTFAGALFDPLAALVLADTGHVDISIVNGEPRVLGGRLCGVDLPAVIMRQNRLAADLVRRAEERYGFDCSSLVWRRAYPYDAPVVREGSQ